jgi:hypothetical protein
MTSSGDAGIVENAGNHLFFFKAFSTDVDHLLNRRS